MRTPGFRAVLPGVELGKPLFHGRPLGHRDKGRCVLEADEFKRRIADNSGNLGLGQQLLGPNEIGDAAGFRARRAAPQPLDGVQARGSPRFDEHDEPQAPGRQGADLVGLDGAAEELCRH